MRGVHLLTAVVLTGTPLTVHAQTRPIEFGVEATGVGLRFSNGSVIFDGAAAGSQVLLGVPISNSVKIEPSLSLGFYADGSSTLVSVQAGIGFPYYLNGQNGHSGFFMHPWAGLDFLSAEALGSSGSDAQFVFGLGFGGKFRVGDRVSFRLEVLPGYGLESEYRYDVFFVRTLFGMSVFFQP